VDGTGAVTFNLSEWALRHQPIILFFIVASLAMGIFAYQRVGRAEDPNITIKTMVVQTEWPGASASEVARLVTDPIERKAEELPWFDYTRSYSKPGESVVFVNLRDAAPIGAVPDQWYQMRKKIGDIRGDLPAGIQGPYFNDEFGDVYSLIFALTGSDYAPAQLRKIAEELREELRCVPGIKKIDLIGVQPEKIYVEVSNRRIASFGLTVDQIIQALQHNNQLTPSGQVDLGSDRILFRVDDNLIGVDAVRSLPIAVGNRQLTLGEIATISRGYEDPRSFVMRVNGQDAIGIGVVMADRANVVELGKALRARIAQLQDTLPLGVELTTVSDEGTVVSGLIGEFVESLLEALAIVLMVSLISLGWRSGLIVALAVPLVLCITLAAMLALHVDLHRISSGALIISLGLLVDDAIIAVEMMQVKMEQGLDRLKAGAFAYRSTAMPMLSGTLVTVIGFVPVGFAHSTTAEFCISIFQVVAVALLSSWLVAVIVTPYLGYHLLPQPGTAAHPGREVYAGPVYAALRRIVAQCLVHRWKVMATTAAIFVAAVIGFGHLTQQFFPSSTRTELLIDLQLAGGASFGATAAAEHHMERVLHADPAVDHFVGYIGGGSPRFYLALDQRLRNVDFAQFVVTAKSLEARDALRRRLETMAPTGFPDARVRVTPLEIGPPVGYAIQFRVRGDDPERVRAIAYRVRDRMAGNPHLRNLNLDWDDLQKRVRAEVDASKAQVFGLTREDVAQDMNLLLSGATVTQYREGTQLIDVVLRATADERLDLAHIGDMNIPLPRGGFIPLAQIATIHYEQEEPVIWRRSRDTTITVQADAEPGMQPPDVSMEVDRSLAELRAALPDGYRIEMGGAIEESAKGQGALADMVPVTVLLMLSVLMFQLQSFARVFMVLLTAPLGLIGFAAALLITHRPFGFVVLVGFIALSGIIMRNSVILVDQIDQDIRAGHEPWDAIVNATIRRARPISLTALAAALGMVPLTGSVFWGPMSVALMGGLIVATLLTLLFVPALYAIWFRVRPVAASTPRMPSAVPNDTIAPGSGTGEMLPATAASV
jgi:multidrug efflux pump